MKNVLAKLKKYYKLILLCLVVIIIVILSLFIYKNLFQQGKSNRLEGIENHQLTKKEITKIEEKLYELDDVESIDVYTNYKIIKIFLELKEDIDFDDVEEKSNELIEEISEKNLSFYDIEIFIDCLDNKSEDYPKIGYKYKTSTKFTWNR
jgi:hypothetical protein